jgi:hypothetical protein
MVLYSCGGPPSVEAWWLARWWQLSNVAPMGGAVQGVGYDAVWCTFYPMQGGGSAARR